MSKELAPVPYSYIKTLPEGSNIHFLAGACPLDSDGVVPYQGDFAKQTELCLQNALTVLAGKNLNLEHICFIRVLVASDQQADLVEAWDELKRHIPDMPPATLQGVTVLGYNDQLVELEIIASS